MIYLDIVNNDYDSRLYVNGKGYQDIDDTWVDCILFLKDILIDEVKVTRRVLDENITRFPERIEYYSDVYRWKSIDVSQVQNYILKQTLKCVIDDDVIIINPKDNLPDLLRFDVITRGRWFVMI